MKVYSGQKEFLVYKVSHCTILDPLSSKMYPGSIMDRLLWIEYFEFDFSWIDYLGSWRGVVADLLRGGRLK